MKWCFGMALWFGGVLTVFRTYPRESCFRGHDIRKIYSSCNILIYMQLVTTASRDQLVHKYYFCLNIKYWVLV